jgi:hypothetical protein
MYDEGVVATVLLGVIYMIYCSEVTLHLLTKSCHSLSHSRKSMFWAPLLWCKRCHKTRSEKPATSIFDPQQTYSVRNKCSMFNVQQKTPDAMYCGYGSCHSKLFKDHDLRLTAASLVERASHSMHWSALLQALQAFCHARVEVIAGCWGPMTRFVC